MKMEVFIELVNSKEIIETIVKVCDDKHAEDIIVLDMNQISLVADYFIICHANNERLVQAIARSIKDAMGEMDISINQMEGFEQARWVVIDTGGVLCHIFHKDERLYYNLERLWGDAPEVPTTIGQNKQ